MHMVPPPPPSVLPCECPDPEVFKISTCFTSFVFPHCCCCLCSSAFPRTHTRNRLPSTHHAARSRIASSRPLTVCLPSECVWWGVSGKGKGWETYDVIAYVCMCACVCMVHCVWWCTAPCTLPERRLRIASAGLCRAAGECRRGHDGSPVGSGELCASCTTAPSSHPPAARTRCWCRV